MQNSNPSYSSASLAHEPRIASAAHRPPRVVTRAAA